MSRNAPSPWSPIAGRRWLRVLVISILLIGIYSVIYSQNWLPNFAVTASVWLLVYGCIFGIATFIVGRRQSSEPVSRNDSGVKDRLAAVDQLRQAGAISETEWVTQRREILRSI